MNDDIFAEIASQLRPDPQVRARLFAEIDAQPEVAPAPRRRGRLAWLAGAAAVALAAGLAIVPSLAPKGHDLSDPPALVTPASSADQGAPADYAQVYSAVERALANMTQRNPWGIFQASSGSFAELSFAAQDSSASGTWDTNSQVAGIDEGDVVKSDGRTIFTASGHDVVLVAADGSGTREVARIDTTAKESDPTEGTVQGPIVDLLLHGTKLVVLVTEYTPRLTSLPSSEPLTYVPYDATQTRALIYDVAEPSAPRFVTSLGQSGAYVTTRLTGDVAYLVTDYMVADPDAVVRDDPATFVPSLFDGSGHAPIGADALRIMDTPTGPSFTVVSSIDLVGDRRIDSQSVFGGTGITYMSDDALFLTSTTYEPVPMSGFALDKATDLRHVSQSTQLAKVRLDDGRLSSGGEVKIPGVPVNQFALDEHEGHLRIAVTMDGATTNTGGWATYSGLFVLDDALRFVGSLPKLAVNEQVQSVRFDGPLAYVVTFRRIDPLFAVDLSVPADPKVMSALKIPGFSTYLHPWSDGLLLGLGVDVTADGQRTGMKLSMFDTSDPFNVTEADTVTLTDLDSEALHNHKAVFVDPARGLVGFAADTVSTTGKATSHYLLYRYGESGFALAGRLPVQQSSTGQVSTARGLTIDGYLYVASPEGVDVYGADSLDKVAEQRFG